MLELANPSVLEPLSLLIGLLAIVVLAAFAVVDLRALMLVRAVSLMKRQTKPGETRVSRDEWAPRAA